MLKNLNLHIWNAPIAKKNEKFNKLYQNLVRWTNEENLFIKKTKTATRPSSNNYLDYFVTNSTLPTKIISVKLKGSDGKTRLSDHNGIYYVKNSNPKTKIRKRNTSNSNGLWEL